MQLTCGKHLLDLSTPQVMGILNVTPDSFFDGGSLYSQQKVNLSAVAAKGEAMVNAGASLLDVGGESTRPGAVAVSVQEECDRVLPVVEVLARNLDVVISVDTSTPQVMEGAAALGAGMINDVRALQREGALMAAAKTQLPVCLMHMQGDPASMQTSPTYRNVVSEVIDFLLQRAEECSAKGIVKEKLLIDPGFGFGKSDTHNMALLESLPQICALGFPVLVGLSRKSMIGRLLGRELDQRLAASLALALVSLQRGAKILRVHDVPETADIVKIHRLTCGEL